MLDKVAKNIVGVTVIFALLYLTGFVELWDAAVYALIDYYDAL